MDAAVSMPSVFAPVTFLLFVRALRWVWPGTDPQDPHCVAAGQP